MQFEISCPACGAEVSGDLAPGEAFACPGCGASCFAPSAPRVALVRKRLRWIVPAVFLGVLLAPILLAALAGLRAPRPVPPVEPIARPARPAPSAPTTLPSAAKRQAADAPATYWGVVVKRDEITDAVYTTIQAIGPEIEVGRLEQTPAILIRRENGKLILALTLGGGSAAFSPSAVPTSIRLDSSPAETEKWAGNNTGELLFYPGNAEEIVARMLLADRLLIRTETIIGHTATARFELSGLRAVWDAFTHDKPYDKRRFPAP